MRASPHYTEQFGARKYIDAKNTYLHVISEYTQDMFFELISSHYNNEIICFNGNIVCKNYNGHNWVGSCSIFLRYNGVHTDTWNCVLYTTDDEYVDINLPVHYLHGYFDSVSITTQIIAIYTDTNYVDTLKDENVLYNGILSYFV